jgi:glycosyltransferase involved in cell wall biosynthesis
LETRAGNAVPRLGVAADFAEEGWPSMDVCAEMLLAHAGPASAGRLRAERLGPPFRRRLGRLPGLGRRAGALNTDRLLNRLWDYPRHLRRRAHAFDLFHVVDHSYSQLGHVLPPGAAGVFCHDLDTFRCLLEPRRDPRPYWFQAMARHILRGFQKAALVFYSTAAVRRQIEAHGLIDPARLVHAPYGVAPEFAPEADPADVTVLPELGGRPFLLHVGSCIPRKRIDVLLAVFAAARARGRDVRLVQVGGEWTADQRAQIARLGVGPAVHQARGLGRPALAALYRRAALVLQPSAAEGFGLPVVEALACGATVVASDLAVLREVAGTAAIFCPVGDVPAWADTVQRLLDQPETAPGQAMRREQAGRYSWPAHARTIADAYLRLLGAGRPVPVLATA